MSFEGETAVVIGFGSSGRAAASVLLAGGATVRVTEARPAEDLAADAEDGFGLGTGAGDEEVEILAGGHRPEHLDGASLVVTSPGVPEGAPILRWAMERGLPVWSELELGARLFHRPYVAVTGTNGKTTTTELLAHMMRTSGLKARACGNVGYPMSIAALEDFEALSVEASSFQLRFHRSLHPRVSVLLNLAPDHLDWHGSFEAYADAKAMIYARQSGDDVHVGNRDDAAAADLSASAPCHVRWFRVGPPEEGEVGVVEGRLVARVDGEQILGSPVESGRPFVADAAAAAAAALAFGLPADAIGSALASFAPLSHRGTTVAMVGSVRFVDDSKATNPHAALASLEGREDAVLIAGGLAKGVDLSPLSAAAPSLAAVIGIGQAAGELEEVFRHRTVVRTAGSIEEAVDLAFEEAHPGRDVLLAPACASQDMFRDYRERGDRFAAAARVLAARLAEEAPSGAGAPLAGGRTWDA